jgi:hypothetical protein
MVPRGASRPVVESALIVAPARFPQLLQCYYYNATAPGCSLILGTWSRR